jgi:hypothetical protein
MRISPQISGCSIVALGHFNPLIFRPEWFRDKEIVIGSDFTGVSIDIIHPEIVAFKLPWGQMEVNRDRFSISAVQEPLVRTYDFFVKCFQALPETPVTAVGLNRDVHFATASQQARNHVGDVLAPKPFWGDFVEKDGKRTGGMRSLVMEQAALKDGRSVRLDGLPGWIHVKVEPSLKLEVPHGVYVHVNDHFDLKSEGKAADGKRVADLVGERWESSIRASEHMIDRIMELASDA